MIRTMPGGGKWYCEQCDVTHDGRTLVMNWTAGKAPAKCLHCEEPSCFFILSDDGSRVLSVSQVVPKREAAQMQRLMQEGGICSAERGAELRKRKEEGR